MRPGNRIALCNCGLLTYRPVRRSIPPRAPITPFGPRYNITAHCAVEKARRNVAVGTFFASSQLCRCRPIVGPAVQTCPLRTRRYRTANLRLRCIERMTKAHRQASGVGSRDVRRTRPKLYGYIRQAPSIQDAMTRTTAGPSRDEGLFRRHLAAVSTRCARLNGTGEHHDSPRRSPVNSHPYRESIQVIFPSRSNHEM